ncbi:MAG: PHP domain-containing protein [Bacilli bacterium]|nr:PHP domain-containing protein [Bacilli bacterium]
MKEFMDLHVHTIYSDGDKTPKEIIKMAKEIGLTTIAITDHDMISGIKTLTEEDLEGIEVIHGVEMTAKVPRARMHILGYGIDVENEFLNEKLNNRVDVRNLKLYQKALKELFDIDFKEEDLQEIYNRPGNVGRPELGKLLIKYGYAKTQDEAFDKYLNPAMDACRHLKVGYSKEECIEMILEAGGIPVLAHPISLKLNEEELRKEIKYLKAIGLMGIETRHIHHTPEYTEMLENLADEFDLLKTGGTDYHGEVKPKVKLGTGINNNVNVTSSTMVDYLRSLNKAKVKCIRK